MAALSRRRGPTMCLTGGTSRMPVPRVNSTSNMILGGALALLLRVPSAAAAVVEGRSKRGLLSRPREGLKPVNGDTRATWVLSAGCKSAEVLRSNDGCSATWVAPNLDASLVGEWTCGCSPFAAAARRSRGDIGTAGNCEAGIVCALAVVLTISPSARLPCTMVVRLLLGDREVELFMAFDGLIIRARGWFCKPEADITAPSPHLTCKIKKW
mmetsp:Transcript_38541/g.96740  ORF Transcript_38541/g.96740 Transcript_38541/m.96740 type:complete len:212 (+) Transcript_38541:524-1159(+)